MKLPRYNTKREMWTGGDSHTLYLFTSTDRRLYPWHRRVLPGGGEFRSLGPNLKVRVATRSEAERYWQSPLHPGWKVASERRQRRYRRR